MRPQDYMTTDHGTLDSEGPVAPWSRGPVVSPFRFHDWPARLAAFIEARRDRAFEWGVHDCCLFAADATRAMTGIDPADALRGYRTALGAARLGRDARTAEDPFGVMGMPARCGFKEIPVAQAARGDLVAMRTGGATAIGVCLGMVSAGAGRAGLSFVPTLACVGAWSF